MSFPTRRLRRLRTSEKMRELIQETTLTSRDLICPVFVQEDLKSRIKVESMSEIERLPLEDINDEVGTISDLNIPSIMLFGIPTKKDDAGTSAFDDNGIVQKAISQIRKNFGDKIVIMADVCLCQFTSTGHCGIIKENKIDNDSSLETLAKIAVSQAKAGVDTVSPSAMMDGQVTAIRKALDDEGFTDVSIMSHSAKHRSSFYSPFRDAAECAPKFGDRRRFNIPIAAYSVSGEYALVKGAAKQGWVNEKDITEEILYCIKRAGADMIVTYFAKSAAKFLQKS